MKNLLELFYLNKLKAIFKTEKVDCNKRNCQRFFSIANQKKQREVKNFAKFNFIFVQISKIALFGFTLIKAFASRF